MEDCLAQRFGSSDSEVDFDSAKYEHRCIKNNPLPKENDCLAPLALTYYDQVLIISPGRKTLDSTNGDLA